MENENQMFGEFETQVIEFMRANPWGALILWLLVRYAVRPALEKVVDFINGKIFSKKSDGKKGNETFVPTSPPASK